MTNTIDFTIFQINLKYFYIIKTYQQYSNQLINNFTSWTFLFIVILIVEILANERVTNSNHSEALMLTKTR